MCGHPEVKGALVSLCLCLCLWMMVAACGSGGGFPDASDSPSRNPGTFTLSWVLKTSNQQVRTCAQAGATTVRVNIADRATGEHASTSFACTLGTAASGALFPSTYDLGFDLLGSAGTIQTAPAQAAVILADQATPLNPVVFLVQ
jgi:hypothetical protein